MTPERLAVLRAIRTFGGQITYPELSRHLTLNDLAARQRLEQAKPLVRKDGKGESAVYSMTKKGWERLAYIEEHLEEVDGG